MARRAQTQERNPFLLMIEPEVVIAAMQKSPRLEQLNRHLCRPLDCPSYAVHSEAIDALKAQDGDEGDEPEAGTARDGAQVGEQ